MHLNRPGTPGQQKSHYCYYYYYFFIVAISMDAIYVDVCVSEAGSTTLTCWESSLMSHPSSVSRVAVHLSVLESCVAWSRSALHAYCRICRRRSNAEMMLLCDGCDRGHHTYCLKPPIKVSL